MYLEDTQVFLSVAVFCRLLGKLEWQRLEQEGSATSN
jgi:hypothetical protein